MRIVAVCTALTVASTTTSGLHAQTDEQKEEAKNLFSDGLDLRDKGDEKGALGKFKAAYGLVKSPITTLEYGRSLLRLKMFVAAKSKLSEAANLPEKSTESPQAKQARKEAADLAKEANGHIATIVLKFEGLGDGEKPAVTVDGTPIESTDEAKIDPGRHEVVARAGEREQHGEVDVGDGETRDLTLTFEGEESASSSTKGRLSTLTLVAFGVAGAGVVVGSITGLMAKSKHDELLSSPDCADGKCGPGAYDTVDSFHQLATISTISFVVAGIAGGVGIYTLLSGGDVPEKPSTAAVTPWIGVGAAGVAGAF